MSRPSLKRRESLVKFIRRASLACLDNAAASLDRSGKPKVAAARQDLYRLRALLGLFRGPLDTQTFVREHAAVGRILRKLNTLDKHADQPAIRTLSRLAANKPQLSMPDALLNPTGQAKPRPKRTRREPVRLRVMADLADLRMRASHWHLPAMDFDAIAPALRRSHRLAATGHAQGAWALRDQLRYLERLWPEAITAPRRVATQIARDADRLATLKKLELTLAQCDGHDALQKRLEEHITAIQAKIEKNASLLRAETPAAFTRRLTGYWDAWRNG